MPAVGVHSSLASNLGHVLPISADRFSALSSDFALLLFIHGREATRPACSIRFHRKTSYWSWSLATLPSLSKGMFPTCSDCCIYKRSSQYGGT